MTELSSAEMARYHRHFLLDEIGVEGQKKLKASKVLIVGAGGLGSPTCLYLAAAGVGTLGIIDNDVVEASNLQRQILHGEDTLGVPKVESAKIRLQNLNPFIEIQTYQEPLTSANAMEIVAKYDLVLDGSDNFPTRYLVNDACVLLNKPNVYGSIFRFDGQASVFNYEDGPCYRCLYPEPPPPGLVPSCAEGGVLGVLPGIVGCIQATEAVKIITGAGKTLSGRLLMFEALSMSFDEVRLQKNPECPLCSESPTVTQLIDYKEFCGIPQAPTTPQFDELTVQQLQSKISAGEDFILLDVREDHELEIVRFPNSMHIPKAVVPDRLNELSRDKPIVVHCKMGGRSAAVCEVLKNAGYDNITNLKGGINAWTLEIETSWPKY